MKKLLIGFVFIVMIFFTVMSAVNASPVFPYEDHYMKPVYTNYYQYNPNSNIPVAAGPFPRYYLGVYAQDDFNHYDDFVDYNDLDVFYPGSGSIDVLRNPYPNHLSQGSTNDSKPMHIYGRLPDGSIYKKHLNHDHEWDLGGYPQQNYPYTEYFTGNSYKIKPVFRNPCQGLTNCQKTHCCN